MALQERFATDDPRTAAEKLSSTIRSAGIAKLQLFAQLIETLTLAGHRGATACIATLQGDRAIENQGTLQRWHRRSTIPIECMDDW